MSQRYRYFDHKEHTLIYWWRKEKFSLREMVRRLRRRDTSISRELRCKCWCGQSFFSSGAQLLAAYRLRLRVKRERLQSNQVRAYIHQKLQIGWSSELIAGCLKQRAELASVRHEAMYQYIYAVAPDCIATLPRHHSKRKRKWPYRKTRDRIKNRQA